MPKITMKVKTNQAIFPVGVPVVFDENGRPWAYSAARGRIAVLDGEGNLTAGGYYAFNLEEGISQMIRGGYLEDGR